MQGGAGCNGEIAGCSEMGGICYCRNGRTSVHTIEVDLLPYRQRCVGCLDGNGSAVAGGRTSCIGMKA